MKIKSKFIKGILIICILFLFAVFVPIGSRLAVYTSVNAEIRNTYREETIRSLDLEGNPIKQYLILNGDLHLNVQEQWGSILVPYVRIHNWSLEEVIEFRKNHPELEQYFPDSNRLDGGIKWIE